MQEKIRQEQIKNKKSFQDEELPHKLFLITREKTKIKNAIARNMLVDIKLSKAKFSSMIQLDGFLRNMLNNLGKNVITDLTIHLVRDNLLDY